MASRCCAAGDLDVQFSVGMLETVFFQNAIGDRFQRIWIAAGDFEFFQAVGRALEMFSAFEEFAAIDADNVINAVGEEEASVVWRNCDF